MERVNALINKLQERTAQQAEAAELLALVQQLQAELVRQISAPARSMSTCRLAASGDGFDSQMQQLFEDSLLLPR